ncbi:cellulase family glycosylhydrolase [Croceitalea sp. P059]|uniref:cellulase family glycosylhydrolase n=1 Tax=Croceitalea sp. P059 TaxID=3075601 RepID=UPI002885C14E|nr:cellulase family glycosylhydrolase [Croceitalea sp. P059]MDT0539019.1 glycoside hydrolase [Croceitalea sp. P059]
MTATFRSLSLIFLTLFIISSCSKETTNQETQEIVQAKTFIIENGLLKKNDVLFVPKGVNALNSFGVDDSGLMQSWNVEIVREFIGNLREQPISGFAVEDSRGIFLHSLEAIVAQHRLENRIVILCPFGWVNEQGERQLFTGLNPSEQLFYNDYKEKMQLIAEFFKGQEDVWIQVWNEPYSFNNSNNYSHELWLNDHKDMVENLRQVDEFDNIILIAGNEQGQGEEVLLEKGLELLAFDDTILFDLHAYGKWHENATVTSIQNRLQNLKDAQLPIIFGEVGVITEGAPLSYAQNFLTACNNTNIGALAWLWNKNTNDQNALLTDDGDPNNTNNFNWGSTFQNFLNE